MFESRQQHQKINYLGLSLRAVCSQQTVESRRVYIYRSGVAHGSPVGFDTELQILRGHKEVVGFLEANVRELLALALREPEFISDLRKC